MKKYVCSLLLAACCAVAILIAPPNAQAEFREEAVALIEKKGPNALMFDGHGFKYFVGRYMQVTALTRCFDENGVRISYADLKFPCQAKIVYRMGKTGGRPEAITIHVEHYRGDREIGTQWNLPVIEPERPR